MSTASAHHFCRKAKLELVDVSQYANDVYSMSAYKHFIDGPNPYLTATWVYKADGTVEHVYWFPKDVEADKPLYKNVKFEELPRTFEDLVASIHEVLEDNDGQEVYECKDSDDEDEEEEDLELYL